MMAIRSDRCWKNRILWCWIVLAFYGCDYVQNLVSVKGAANPFMFVVLLVGVQGVAEFLVSGILGGIVARAVAKFVK